MKIRRQKGMSLIGFLMLLSLIIFMVYLGIRIGPIYLEYFSVVSAMNGVAAERGAARKSPYDIRVGVLNRLYISYSAENVREENIKIIRRNGVQLRVVYQVRKPVIGNLDVVASFDRMVRLSN